MHVNSDCIPNLTTSTSNGSTKVTWNCMTDKDVRKYCTLTDKSLHEIYIPTEAVSCKHVHCSDENHIGYELPPSTMNFCCHVIVVKAIT